MGFLKSIADIAIPGIGLARGDQSAGGAFQDIVLPFTEWTGLDLDNSNSKAKLTADQKAAKAKAKRDAKLANGEAFTPAEMAADQWDLYRELYLPGEKALTNQASAPLPVDYLSDRAGQNINDAFNKQAIILDRDQSRYGVTENAKAREDADQQTALIRAAAEAGARNSTRKEAADLALQRLDVLAKIGEGIPAEAFSSGLTAKSISNTSALNRTVAQNNLIGMGMGAVSGVAGQFKTPAAASAGKSGSPSMFDSEGRGMFSSGSSSGTYGQGGNYQAVY